MTTPQSNGSESTSYADGRLPDDVHRLAAYGSPDEQALFHSVYGAVYHEGGDDLGMLETLYRAGVAMLAVLHAEYKCRDSLGPRPDGTKEIALAAVQMHSLLNAIKNRSAGIDSLVRPVSKHQGSWDYGNTVPAAYAEYAIALASVSAWPGEETGE
jgi:hypothetical protein